MAAKRKARKTRSQPESALAKANKAKAQDVDYSQKQVGFLGHLGSIHKGKSALKLVPLYSKDDEADNLPIMILSFMVLILAVSIFALAFLDIPDIAFRFRP